MNLKEIAWEINEHVDVRVLINDLNIHVKQNRIKCIAHKGDDYNMVLYERTAYCHVCQATLNPVGIYMRACNVDFKTAVSSLDAIYNLRLLNLNTKEVKKLEMERKRKEQEQEQREKQEQYNYLRCYDFLSWLKECLNEFKHYAKWDYLIYLACIVENLIEENAYAFIKDIDLHFKKLLKDGGLI